jgi:plastocyanin
MPTSRTRLAGAGNKATTIGALVVAALAVALTVAALAPAAGEHRVDRRAPTVHVDIRNFAFHPRSLKVGRGTRVVFANRSSVTHTATRRGSFSTGRIRPGHSAAIRFTQSGVYPYHCLIHPEMHGKIVVG